MILTLTGNQMFLHNDGVPLADAMRAAAAPAAGASRRPVCG